MNIYPYVYRIDHPSGEFYIGSRAANRVPAERDIGHRYKTSTKKLSYPFEEYRLTVIAEFFTATAKKDAYDFEQLTIFESWGHPSLANKHCTHGKQRFSTAGTKLSAEHIAKLKQKTISEEHKRRIAEANKMRPPMSDEQRKKMSESTVGIKRTEEGRQRMVESWKLRPPRTEEHKRKIAEALTGRRGTKLKPFTDEHKQRMSEASKGKPKSEEHKRNMALAQQRRWAKP